ncbi:hypothetical protein Droror1_Dr00007877 [Drosera rotundifolia]
MQFALCLQSMLFQFTLPCPSKVPNPITETPSTLSNKNHSGDVYWLKSLLATTVPCSSMTGFGFLQGPANRTWLMTNLPRGITTFAGPSESHAPLHARTKACMTA